MKKRLFGKKLIAAATALVLVGGIFAPVGQYSTPQAKAATESKKLAKIFRTTELEDASIDALQKAMKSGRLTSKQLTQMYIDRIKAYDEKLKLNSVIAINPNALKEAEGFDKERKKGKVRGALHGIPIIVKDNIDVKNMPTTAGSLALYYNIPNKDSYIIKKLRKAGAVIIGKANLSEFASSAVDSKSVLGGTVHNPYDFSREPGGSSGGTGVAVTCNFCAAGLGTDTGGSIRMPSICNNLYGIRPSKGLTSIGRVIPLDAERDTTGPIARNAKDLSYVLENMSGTDAEDDYTKEVSADKLLGKGYSKYLKKDYLKGKRIGYFDVSFNDIEEVYEEDGEGENYDIDVTPPDKKVQEMLLKTRANLRKAGAELVDISDDLNRDIIQEELNEVEANSVGYTFEYDMNSYFHTLGDRASYKTLKELVNSGNGVNFTNLFEDVDSLADSYETTRNPYTETASGYARTTEWEYMLKFRQKINEVISNNNLDAIMYMPTMNVPSVLEQAGHQLSKSRLLWVFGPDAGLPEVVIPMGFADTDETASTELPSGIALVGAFGKEKKLMQVAYAYQLQAGSVIRRAPACVPALKDNRLNSFLKKLIKKVSKWNTKKLSKKKPTLVKLLENACVKAAEVNWSKPKEVYKRAKALATYYDNAKAAS